MKRLRKFACLLVFVFVLQGCGQSKNEETSIQNYENSFVLTCADGAKFIFPNQEDFIVSQDGIAQSTSSIELSYKSLFNNNLELKVFQNTKDYGEQQIKEELKSYVKRYQNLAEQNEGKVFDSVEEKALIVSDYTINYTGIFYELGGRSTYSSEFFTVIDEYIIYGTLRLEEDSVEELDMEQFLTSLFEELRMEG